MGPEETIEAMPARRVATVLRDLATLRARTKDGRSPKPIATFCFRSGRSIVGELLALQEEREGWAVAVRLLSSSSATSLDVCYLDPAMLEAVTIHDAHRFAADLSSGRVAGPLIPPPDGSPPPTRLAVERRRGALSDKGPLAIEIDWPGFVTSGEPLRVLERQLVALHEALEQVGRDDLGRASLASLKAARLRHGPEPAVGTIDGRLEIVCQPERGDLGCFGRDVLRSKIEESL
ncbi:MAG: hypothetical protein IPK13_04190 [Deltaproteobacteria bacterium]|nr:hypothetical protein [Deltaproteobacteria bacterium]